MRNINWEKNQDILRNNISNLGIGRLLVHADSFKSLGFIDFNENQDENLDKHVKLLSSLAPNVVLPFFNYGFPKTRLFNFNDFTCETGAISEAFGLAQVKKTFDPMFSMSYTSELNCFGGYEKSVNTFQENGIFSRLVTNDTGILFYGAGIKTATLIHYVEAIHKVVYRYYKSFGGIAIIDGSKKELEFVSHFRPMECYLDYDWERISEDLIANELVISMGKHCKLFNARHLFEFWSEKMKDDPLYFLDQKSLLWVKPKLDFLGRGFRRSDFESE